ncbi:hypothetical protein EJB05_24672, partial [Eragrostis curvula]
MEPKRRRLVNDCVMEKKRSAGSIGGVKPKRLRLMEGKECFHIPIGIEDDLDTFSPDEYIHLYNFPPSELRMTVVDGEMAVFFQIGVFVRGISIWDDGTRWWNLWLFQGFLSPINGVGVDWDAIIHDDREDVPIDSTVVKSVIDIYVEVKLGQRDFYEAHFEKALLAATSQYYCKKAHAWILDYSCQQYMAKVEVSLEEEKQRAARYMPSSSKPKILQAVQVEMMQIFVDKILKDDTSGFQALLCDKKDDDLSRMFVLFAAADGGLIQLSKIFKEHILKEVASLKKEAACSSCRINEFVYKVIKLHDKYTEYIDKCFNGHPMFKKALKEAFECVCNEDVADRSIADVFSTYCVDVLTKTEEEMRIIGPTEEIVEKIVNLLTYMSSKDIFLQLYRKKLEMRSSIDGKIEIAFLLKLKPWFGVQYSSSIDDIVKYLTVQMSADKVKLLGGMNCGPVQSDDIHYQVLDEYLNSARVVSIDARTRLAFNQLVLEYITPFSSGFKRNAKYTLEGYSIFGGLVSHVTNGHAVNKSWNGKITSKMFFVIQGQIHMFSWAWALGKTFFVFR